MKAKNIGNLIKSLALAAAMCAPLMAGIGFGDNVKAAENELTNVYRAYSPKSGEHIFSTVETYVRNLEPLGWVYEGIAYRGAKDSYSNITAGNSSNRIVYGLREKDAASEHDVKHLYTTDKNEYEVLQKRGWRGDGAIFFAPNTSAYPVHRLFNPRAASSLGAHHYTADANEIRVLVTQGWNDEGIVFYSAGPGEAASTSPSTGSGSNTVVSSNAGRSKELEDAYFEELNKIRVSEGLKPYIRNAQMDAAAGSRLDYVIDFFSTGKYEVYLQEKKDLEARGINTFHNQEEKFTYPPHKGSEEAYNKYVTDPTLHQTGENTGMHTAYGTPSDYAKATLNATKNYSISNQTGHWSNLMGKSDTQIGIGVYVKNGKTYECIMFAGPSDGSTLAGFKGKYNKDGKYITYYDDPFDTTPHDQTYNYIFDNEWNEFVDYQWKRFQEGFKDNYQIVAEFRKMKDNK